MAYWKEPFPAALTRGDLIEFVVLDLELRDASWASAGRARGRRSGPDAFALAEVTLARKSDFGLNDRTYMSTTHLGHLLKVSALPP